MYECGAGRCSWHRCRSPASAIGDMYVTQGHRKYAVTAAFFKTLSSRAGCRLILHRLCCLGPHKPFHCDAEIGGDTEVLGSLYIGEPLYCVSINVILVGGIFFYAELQRLPMLVVSVRVLVLVVPALMTRSLQYWAQIVIGQYPSTQSSAPIA